MSHAALGIDVAKLKCDVVLLHDGKARHKVCPNTAAGFAELGTWLRRAGVDRIHACLEATGTYGEALALWLYEQGHVVSVVNPAAIRAYAESRLTRAKTDKVDAELIARFCATEAPPVWTPLPQPIRELQAMVRRLEALQDMERQERNRLEAGAVVPTVRRSITAVLKRLDHELVVVRRAIREHFDQHPTLRGQRDLLTSIPGIGDTTATLLLAELDMKRYHSARQLAAFTGLTPRITQSGTSVRRRGHMCKLGPGRIRRALYFPALSALRHNPIIQLLDVRLTAARKPRMVIVGAAMRKLLHLVYGVLKTQQPFRTGPVSA
jgi:transposase